MQVHQDKCFAPSQVADVQYHITLPGRTLQPDVLPVLGMITAQLMSSTLAVPASYARLVASANTAVRVPPYPS